jgi:hypothetical protein
MRARLAVVFTDGTDHAGRVAKDGPYDAVDKSRDVIFASGVEAEVDDGQLGSIRRGRLKADGFGAPGDPNQPPAF